MPTVKSRVIIRHLIVFSLLIFLALAAPRCWQGTRAESATTTKGLPSLRGEEALTPKAVASLCLSHLFLKDHKLELHAFFQP